MVITSVRKFFTGDHLSDFVASAIKNRSAEVTSATNNFKPWTCIFLWKSLHGSTIVTLVFASRSVNVLFGPKQLSILATYFTKLLYLMLNYISGTAGKRSFDIYHFQLFEKYASKHLPGFMRLIFQRKSCEHTRNFMISITFLSLSYLYSVFSTDI